MNDSHLIVQSIPDLCKALGLPRSQVPRMILRRDLVLAIYQRIKQRGLTHAHAAKTAAVGRTVITAIMNGNIGKISTDKLIDIATRLGIQIDIKIAC